MSVSDDNREKPRVPWPYPPRGPAKDKPFRAALNRELRIADGDPKKLDLIAATLVGKAIGGDISAIREVAERLDGKVPQAIVGSSEHPGIMIQSIERRIVDLIDVTPVKDKPANDLVVDGAETDKP